MARLRQFWRISSRKNPLAAHIPPFGSVTNLGWFYPTEVFLFQDFFNVAYAPYRVHTVWIATNNWSRFIPAVASAPRVFFK